MLIMVNWTVIIASVIIVSIFALNEFIFVLTLLLFAAAAAAAFKWKDNINM